MVERGGSGGPQNMEIDRLSDAEEEISSPPILDLALVGQEVVERPTLHPVPVEYTGATLALEGPPPSGFSGTLVPATSGDLVPMTRRHQQRQRKGGNNQRKMEEPNMALIALISLDNRQKLCIVMKFFLTK